MRVTNWKKEERNITNLKLVIGNYVLQINSNIDLTYDLSEEQ